MSNDEYQHQSSQIVEIYRGRMTHPKKYDLMGINVTQEYLDAKFNGDKEACRQYFIDMYYGKTPL